jgi:hypothetical protein
MAETISREGDRKSQGDHKSEAERFAVYGLDPKEVLDKPLAIPPDTRMVLSAEKLKEPHPALKKLEPKDIKDVKRWIGVPDEIGMKRAPAFKLPSRVPAVDSPKDLRRLAPEEQISLRQLAHEYVHGDSRRVAAFTPVLNQLVIGSWINVFAIRQDVHIHNGAVLTIGASVKVLLAANIYIWAGGQLRVVPPGPAKVDCYSITGNYTGVIHHVFDTMAFDRLISKEA